MIILKSGRYTGKTTKCIEKVRELEEAGYRTVLLVQGIWLTGALQKQYGITCFAHDTDLRGYKFDKIVIDDTHLLEKEILSNLPKDKIAMMAFLVEDLKLSEIPQESKIYCEVSDGSSYVTFHNLDGLYSYCTTEKGEVCHLHNSTLVQKYKDGYKILDYESG